MKKYIIFLASLAALTCTAAYASDLWGTDGDGSSASQVSIEKLHILFFQGSGQSSGGVYWISGKASYPEDKTLKIKALESSSAEPVGLLHNGSEQYCKNVSEFILNSSKVLCDEVKKDMEESCSDKTLSDKYCVDEKPDYSKISGYGGLYDTTCKIDSVLSGNSYICVGSLGNSYINYCVKPQYDGEQSFTCSLSAAANPSLSKNSKIKLQLFADDKAIAETDPFEIKDALDGKVAFEDGIKTLTYLILEELKGEEVKLEDAPIEQKDTDNDGATDISDNFPTISNPDQTPAVAVTQLVKPPENVSSPVSSGGGDCSLDPTATANGAGWLLDFIILGLPAALVGIRRKI